MKKRKIIRDADTVRKAVLDAKSYAQERGIPLTIERIAFCLGVTRDTLRGIADGDEDEPDTVVRAVAAAIGESVAEVMEYGLTKGVTAAMPVFYLKSNAGYNDKGEASQDIATVIFINGDSIEG